MHTNRGSQKLGQIIEFGFARWLASARKYRGVVIAVWTILALIAGWYGASTLGINTDTSDMIDANAPYRQDQAVFEAAFPQFGDQILILIRSDTPDGADAFGQALALTLSKDTAHVKSIFSPALDPFFRKNGLLFLDIEDLENTLDQLTQAAPLIERLTLNPSLPSLFDALVQAAEQDNSNSDAIFSAVADTLDANISGADKPLSWRLAFNSDLDTPYQRLLTLDPVLDTRRLRPAAAVEDAILSAVQTVQDETNINAQIYVTGNPVLRSDELKSVSQGIGLAFFISFLLVGALLIWALRSVVLAGFTLLSLIISIAITAGIAALIYTELNLVSIAFTVLMVGLGVDFAIHLLLHIVHERGQGKSTSAAYYRSARGIGLALVLTAPSTALAFLAFAPTRFAGMSQLGIIAAIGVITAFLVATSFLPAIYAYLPPPKSASLNKHIDAETKNVPNTKLALIVIGAGLLAALLLPQARFDADPMSLRSRNAPSVIAFNQLFDKIETVPYRLSHLADDEAQAQIIAGQFENLSTVKSARSLGSFIPSAQLDKLELIDYAAIGLEFAVSGEGEPYPIAANPTMRLITALKAREDAASIRLQNVLTRWDAKSKDIPELRSRSERDLLFYWPYELDLLRAQIQAREVTRDNLPQNIVSNYVSNDGRARVEIAPSEDVRNIKFRTNFINDVKSISPNISGSARSVQEAGQIIQRAMLQAIFTALIMVSILLYVVVRNVRLVMIMLIPLILAGVLTTTTATLLGLSYNFANVIVLPLLIGIGVDSSLHLALKSYKTAGQSIGGVKNKASITSRAVLFSGFTTIASFGSLTFSVHRGTSSMGALLSIAIVWVIICTVIITPSLMHWFGPKTGAKKLA